MLVVFLKRGEEGALLKEKNEEGRVLQRGEESRIVIEIDSRPVGETRHPGVTAPVEWKGGEYDGKPAGID